MLSEMSTKADGGILFVVSSPSGAGKTTLCHRLIREVGSRIAFSISYTTRPRRGSEKDGVDYVFVSEQEFSQMVADDAFAEWAEVHGFRYGTARQTIEDNFSQGRDVLFDIDYQGARQLRKRYPNETAMIFILPPSFADLAQRLRGRKTDKEDVMIRRLQNAAHELRQYGDYDYLVVNHDLEEAFADLLAIYRSAHLAAKRCSRRAEQLLAEIDGLNPADFSAMVMNPT